MANEELHGLIARLHAELGRTSTLDEESRHLLQQVAGDVARLQGGDPGHGPRMESLAQRLEASHPAVSAALRSLVDSLSRAGV